MRMFVDPRAVYLYPKTTLSTINANTLVASNGGVGGTGAAGGSGGQGGVGGFGFGVFIGGNTPATLEGNTITTGNGAMGASGNFTNELNAAGSGGWVVGIFDGDTTDSLTPEQSNNTITLGAPGQGGVTSADEGEALETNF
jgi:hypothetical protein